MAFPAQGPAGGQPAPIDPNQDFEGFVGQLVDAKVAAAQAAAAAGGGGTPTAAAPAAQPIVIKLKDGTEHTYTSQEELNNALNNTFDAFHNKINELSRGGVPDAAPAPTDKPQFDGEKFVGLMNEDPTKAFDYVDSFRYFDGEVENPSDAIKDMMTRQASTERVLAAYQFKDAHPEFQMAQNGPQIIETIMKQAGMDFNFQNLELALAKAQQAGMLPTRQQYVAAVQQNMGVPTAPPADGNPPQGYPPPQPAGLPQPMAQPAPYQAPPARPAGAIPGNPPHMNVFNPNVSLPQQAPPSMGSPNQGTPPQNWQERAEDLTPEQIEEVFRQVGG
jgi:hypothetical protein